MTSAVLSLWIALGIALQLGVFLAIKLWRYRREYDALPMVNEAVDRSLGHHADERSELASWSGYRSFKVLRKVIEDAAQSVCSFYLVPEDGKPLPTFLPGQFLRFALDLPLGISSGPLFRCYSLSDAPRPDYYRVSIKRILAPAGSDIAAGRSSNYFHDQIEVGDRLQVSAPTGHFYLEKGTAPVVLIAGGIGITPLLSMLNWSLAEQSGREIWLFYGVRDGAELMMRSHLEALSAAHANFHLHLCFSKSDPTDSRSDDLVHHGRIDVALLRQQLPLKPYHFYLCGPTMMLESVVAGLDDWGVAPENIHYEAFGPASIKRQRVAEPVVEEGADLTQIEVTFARSGKRLAWPATAGNLLDFAEAQGMMVNSACRAGACGSCQTKVLSGEVRYQQTPDYDPEPGTCLLCVGTPKTSLTLEI